jgi:hypothetical protein
MLPDPRRNNLTFLLMSDVFLLAGDREQAGREIGILDSICLKNHL